MPRLARWLLSRPARRRSARSSHPLALLPLEDRLVPDGRPLPLPVIAAGAGVGAPPAAKLFDALDGATLLTVEPFGSNFTGGVRVAVGDFTGDGYPELVAAAGVGGGPHVRAFDGKTGQQIPGPLGNFYAYTPTFMGGVMVAVGNVTGDRRDDLVTAADEGGGPHVKVFDGSTGKLAAEFFAFEPEFRGGVRVAVGDLAGLGRGQLILAAGPGGGPRVRVLDAATLEPVPGPLGDAYQFPSGQRDGVWPAAGDVTGDGRADLVVGAAVGKTARVRVLDGATGAEVQEFQAFPAPAAGGVRVATAFVDDDPYADVVVGSGPGADPRVRTFGGKTGDLLAGPVGDFAPGVGAAGGGVFVAAGNDPPYIGTTAPNITLTRLAPGVVRVTGVIVQGDTNVSPPSDHPSPTGVVELQLQEWTGTAYTSPQTVGSVPLFPAGTWKAVGDMDELIIVNATKYVVAVRYPGDDVFGSSGQGVMYSSPDATPVVAGGTCPPPPALESAPGPGGNTPPVATGMESTLGRVGNTPPNTTGNPVRYFDGTNILTATDLTSAGMGGWGAVRTWTNRPEYAVGSHLGNGWVAAEQPRLVRTLGGLVRQTADAHPRWYDGQGTPNASGSYASYKGRFDTIDGITYDAAADQFVLDAGQGTVLRFAGFTAARPAAHRGALESRTDPGGTVTAVTARDTAGRPTEVQASVTAGGVTTTESYLSTYLGAADPNAGRLAGVTLRRQVNGGAWQTVRAVGYTYYGAGDANGTLGDLKRATVTDPAGAILDQSYYRYYTADTFDGGTQVGYAGGLRYALGPAATARLKAAAGGTDAAVDAAADATVAGHADNAFRYDAQRRTTQEVVAGDGCSACSAGQGTYTYAYTTSANPDGYNAWRTRTVETRPDGTVATVYTNAVAQVMLSAVQPAGAPAGQTWATYYRYQGGALSATGWAGGRLELTAAPSAVTGYSDASPDLVNVQGGNAQHLADAAGLVQTYAYYPATTATETAAGGAKGYTQGVAVRRGELGADVLQAGWTYYRREAAGATVSPVAVETVYRNPDGTGGQTTGYAYTWMTGRPRAYSVTATLPTVTTGQNGPGTATTTTTVFDAFGRPVWVRDADGFLGYTAYDPATGAAVKAIADVNTANTADFAGLPAGWSTPAGGGLHLVTAAEVDPLGRVTKTTAPNGRVDYTVYTDPAHEVRSYPGWDQATNTPTGPTAVWRDDRASGYTEALTMSAAPAVGGGRPTGTEGVTGLQSLARAHRNPAGQTVHTDAYHTLAGLTYATSPTLGTEGAHFDRTRQGYDHQGRPNKTVSPAGTIYRTEYDGLGRATSEWVGTDDTPATGFWSVTNTAGTDMVKTADHEYDGGGVGDGNRTKTTESPGLGAAARVTQTWYDWRNRPVAVKQGVETTEAADVNRPLVYTQYNNLNQPVFTERYDADGVTPAVTNGVPDRPAAGLLRAKGGTSYDELGRVYRQDQYSVDPVTGAVGPYTLHADAWYDRRGNVAKTLAPGGLAEKAAYDGAGRATTSYTTDGGGDAGWADALTVTGDVVLTQTEAQYDPSGNVLRTLGRERFHDAAGTGPLGTALAGVPARASYAGYYFDRLDRVTAMVDAGTSGSAVWNRPAAPPGAGSAGFGGADDATQGSWVSRYGAEGYRLAGAGGPAALPAWAALTTTGASEPGFISGGTDPKLLQVPGSAVRGRGVWFTDTQFDLDLTLSDGQTHRVGLYALDHDGHGGGRAQRVEVIDRDTGAVLDSRDLTAFGGGRWLTWDLAGRVRFRVTNLNPNSNALVNALVIDPGSRVSRTAYDAAGRAWKSVSPRGIESRVGYDALGRVTRTVEHYVDGVVSDNDDRTTEYAYGPAGLVTLTARLTGGGGQTTQWVYGVSPAGGSAVASNDAVGKTYWPDPATGAASSGQQDLVAVNALGQPVTTTDRNTTTHALAYDVLGRPVSDAVTLFGVNVDQAVRRIETAYDGRGNVGLVTSYNAATGGGVVNQVKREYNGLGQLATEWQAAAGAVTGASPRVGYAYSAMAGGANHSRPTLLTYPDGRQVAYSYGPAGGLDDRVGRLAALTDGATALEDYAYLGLGTVVRRGRPQTGTELTHVRRPGQDLTDAGDQYTGLDRYGQVINQRWLATATGADLDWTGLFYDRDGDRTARANWLNGGMTEFYATDGLGQLTRSVRGSASRDWDFDAAGNWETVADNGTVTQTRTHNRQNEVTTVSGAVAPTFDPAGNMTGDQTGKTLVYDGWNRLAAVKSGATTLAAYAYDGLGRRVAETSGGTATTLLYSAGWQVLEERVGGAATTQYVWSPVYVDALVVRDRDADGSGGTGTGGREERLYALQDANWNTTALISTSGTVVERYAYDPFGAVTVYSPTYSPLSASGYAWTVLFQGLRQSPTTGLYHARHRDYSATLGRWVTNDPIKYRGRDVNLYRMEANNPTNRIDPSGLLTNAEISWCVKNPCCCAAARNSGTEVKSEMGRRYPSWGDNTVENAVQHCAWMCYVTSMRACSEGDALALGIAHEEYDGNPVHDRKMDLYNNSVGVSLGRNGQSLAECFDKCEAMAKAYELYWYSPVTGGPRRGLPGDYPGFDVNKNGVPGGGVGTPSPVPPGGGVGGNGSGASGSGGSSGSGSSGSSGSSSPSGSNPSPGNPNGPLR